MEIVISAEQIENTKIFKELGKIDLKHPVLNNKLHQNSLLKRKSREEITHVLLVYKNTGVIEPILSKYQLLVFQELAEKVKPSI